MSAQRQNIATDARWATIVGYSRAVRVGRAVYVSGTAPIDAAGGVEVSRLIDPAIIAEPEPN